MVWVEWQHATLSINNSTDSRRKRPRRDGEQVPCPTFLIMKSRGDGARMLR
jgi:hypothetical protein